MPGPHFTLERFVWRRYGDRWLSRPGTDPMRTFHDRSTAEAAARELEWELRRRVNPFAFGERFLHYQTTFDAPRLFDWCLDHGLEPPAVAPESPMWEEWWERHQPRFTDVQRAAVWEALNRVRFYRVIESEPAEPMHLVALPHLEYDPIPRSLGEVEYVGCTPYMLVRSRATAIHLCQQLFIDQWIAEGGGAIPEPVRDSWEWKAGDPFGDDSSPEGFAQSDFAEHRPLGLTSGAAPTPGREVFVVLRRGWRIEEGGTAGSWRWSPTQARTCGRPVAAFGTLAAADALVARLEAEAREAPSPFRFGTALEWGTLPASGVWGVLSGMTPIVFTNQWSDYQATDREWNRWWDRAVPGLTAEQVETAWALFEGLKFYEVVAVEFRECARPCLCGT